MRAALASNGCIISCFWSSWLQYTPFHYMGMGETVGYCLKTIQNNINTYEQDDWVDVCVNRNISLSLQGDPTLRLHIVCPVNSLQSAITADSTVMLAWKPADDSIIGYYVYRLDTITNTYNRLTPLPITETWCEDSLPLPGNNDYMIRALKLSQVACGSYYNLSQGTFDTINYIDQAPVPVSDLSLSLDPGNTLPLKIYEPFQVNVTIIPEKATNKLLRWSVENMDGQGKFDKDGMVIADKGGKIAVIAEALDGSNAKGRIEVTIDSIPDAAGEITGESTVCRDNSKSLYTVSEIRGASSYIWTSPTGEIDTASINEIEYYLNKNASSGYLSVKGHNIYTDGPESQLYITLNEIPPRPVVILQEGTLHSSSQSGNQWYKWDQSNYFPLEGATDSIYIPTEHGSYFVRVTINGCTSSSSNSIQYPTGLDTEGTCKALMYPNPSTGMVTISFGEVPEQNAEIKVYNLYGKQVYSKTYPHIITADIDLTAFPKGIYIIKIITDENNYFGKVSLE
jgi:hypothetical protein